mmetsp:Transcript_35610/g.85730  ORF Transcript_35610/g.85730 Transcript_35610/m.85730 type:complete len:212 (-) Transcript_35610:587-1222(-)
MRSWSSSMQDCPGIRGVICPGLDRIHRIIRSTARGVNTSKKNCTAGTKFRDLTFMMYATVEIATQNPHPRGSSSAEALSTTAVPFVGAVSDPITCACLAGSFSIVTSTTFSRLVAMSRAVLPSLSCSSGSAPFSKRNFTTAAWFASVALCIAVIPCRSTSPRFMSKYRKSRSIIISPLYAAQCTILQPLTSLLVRLQPSLIRRRNASFCSC